MIIGIPAFIILTVGILLRHNRRWHPPLMLTGIGLDFLLLIVLELNRSAIYTATTSSLTPLQIAHIVFSSIAGVLFIPVAIMGYYRLKNVKEHLYPWHFRLGVTSYVCRVIGFVTMFSFV